MRNYEKILELLPSYGYDGNNLVTARERVIEQFIDGSYKALVNEDGRFIKKIEQVDRELLDNGWKLFCHCFNDFVNRNEIKYENFISNSFNVGNQKKKLFKSCRDFYGKDISDEIEKISALSLPKKEELYIVLSVNYNDFILCSTGNPWTSCLDLECGQYSSSLSGFLFDKNRAMIYITDKTKKTFNGIESYVMFSRMWCLLDKSNTININISYPTRENMSEKHLSQITGLTLKNIDNGFISKYEIDELENKNNIFVFGYQDFTRFKSTNDLHLVFSEDTGCYSIIKNFDGKKEIVNFDDVYQIKGCGKPLNELLLTECSICGNKTSRVSFVNGDGICKSCFDKASLICCECGHPYKRKFITTENEIICTKCKNKNGYIKCKKCHKYFESYGDDICEECYSKIDSKCDICHNIIPEYKLIDLSKTMFMTNKKTFKPFNTRGKACNDCIETFCEEQEIIFCENCGKYYESNKERKCIVCGEQTQ